MSDETTDTQEAVLKISTEVSPGKKVEVDGDSYTLINPDHLSEGKEARVMSRFAMHGRMAEQLDRATTEQEADKIVRKLRTSRIGLICELTDIPEEVAAKIPLSDQAALLRQIQTEMGVGHDGDPL